MGTSTNAQICYGIAFEEDYEFPWHDEDDIEAWWLYRVHGFKHSFELFDNDGNYLDGREPSREEASRYFDESREFLAAHPLPVVLVNYCASDSPMYALAVHGSVVTARRGLPTAFDPAALTVKQEQVDALLRFCTEYGFKATAPQWLLTSYWG